MVSSFALPTICPTLCVPVLPQYRACILPRLFSLGVLSAPIHVQPTNRRADPYLACRCLPMVAPPRAAKVIPRSPQSPPRARSAAQRMATGEPRAEKTSRSQDSEKVLCSRSLRRASRRVVDSGTGVRFSVPAETPGGSDATRRDSARLGPGRGGMSARGRGRGR